MIYQAAGWPHGPQSIALTHTVSSVGQNEKPMQEMSTALHCYQEWISMYFQ